MSLKHEKNSKSNNAAVHTIVSRLLAAVPVHLPIILSIHFLWMAALHSGGKKSVFLGVQAFRDSVCWKLKHRKQLYVLLRYILPKTCMN